MFFCFSFVVMPWHELVGEVLSLTSFIHVQPWR